MTDVRCQVCDATTDAFLCQHCSTELTKAIAELPAGLKELDITASRQARVGNTPATTRTPDVPMGPIKPPPAAWLRSRDGHVALPETALQYVPAAADLRNAAINAVVTWSRHLVEQRGAHPPATTTTTGLCTWLVEHADTIRLDEAAAEIHTHFVSGLRQLTWIIDRHDPGAYAGRCDAPDVRMQLRGQHTGPLCQAFTCGHDSCAEIRLERYAPVLGVCGAKLYAGPNKTEIDCPSCGARYNVDERRATMLDKLDDEWATPAKIAAALASLDLPVTDKTINTWAQRAKQRRARNRLPEPLDFYAVALDDGKPLYRVGEVRAKVEQAAEGERLRAAERAGNDARRHATKRAS